MSYGHVQVNFKTIAMLILFIVTMLATIFFFYWMYQVWVL